MRIASKLLPYEREALAAPQEEGARALRVDFAPSPERAANGLSINSVRERVGSIAEIVKVVPLSIPRSSEGPGGIKFVLLLVTSSPDEAIAAAVGVDASSVFLLARAPLARTSGEALGGEPASLSVGASSALATEGDDDIELSTSGRRSIVRVDVQRLDDAMEQLSSLIVTRSRLSRAVAELSDSTPGTRELLQIVKENARQLRDLRAAILRVRMVPVAEVLERVPLIVRGLRRETGKQVRLVVDPGGAELDKAVAERIFPAIVHLVRNAIDHGIESPEDRVKAGKPKEATLKLASTARSNTRLELTISDDGRGVDRAAVVRRAGREIGPSDDALLDALCEAGLSTREEASTTSGRGLGMDIVKRIVVGQLGGELLMKTERGVGTTFTLRVPLTIAIVDAFVLDCGDQQFTVPVSMVEEILEIDHARIVEAPGMSRSLRLGTRGSPLAVAQSTQVADQLRARGVAVELHTIRTTGDRIQDRPLADAGGKGLFTKELELALIAGEVDFAVHSYKDVPVTMPLVDAGGLAIAAVPPRGDVRDVLVAAGGLPSLRQGARVGTGSLRRRCQLLAMRPDMDVVGLRGNIDTRLRKWRAGEVDGIVLAAAGLHRAGLFDRSCMVPFDADQMVPAAGQGALALQCRADDAATRAALATLDDPATRAAVDAERLVVGLLEADCHSPLGVFARADGDVMGVTWAVGSAGGEPPVHRRSVAAPAAGLPAALRTAIRASS